MKRIFFRITVLMLFAVVLIFVIFASLMVFKHNRNAARGDIDLVNMARTIYHAERRNQPNASLDEIVQTLANDANLPLTKVSWPQPIENLGLITYNHRESTLWGMTMKGPVIYYAPADFPGSALRYGPFRGTPAPGTRELLLLLILVLAVVAVTGYIYAAPFVRRLEALEMAAVKIGRGQLDVRVNVGPADAIGSLESHFNGMTGRVEDLLERQKQLMRSVAHELRTPIARMHFILEMLQSSDEKVSTDLREELGEIESLIKELLTLCRFDMPDPQLEKTEIDPAESVARIISKNIPLHADVQVIVEDDGLETTILADPTFFDRAIENIVSNALRFAQSQVRIDIQTMDDSIALIIDDDGPGIPKASWKNVSRPFFRVDKSRSRSSGGIGLGLAIVKGIIEAHKGSFDIMDAPVGGARVVTHWPIGARPESDEKYGYSSS